MCYEMAGLKGGGAAPAQQELWLTMSAERSTIHSACECQAILFASLDDKNLVVGAWAVQGIREEASAQSIGTERALFEVSWLCPFCGRHALRRFDAAALRPCGSR